MHGTDGLTVSYNYTGGVFNNAQGGLRTREATKYMGVANLFIHGRTEQLGLWKNGGFGMSVDDYHGESISEMVGDSLGLSVFEYPPRAQISEYWYEHSFYDQRINVKLGKLDGATYFGVLDCVGTYVHSSFTTHANNPIPTISETGMGMIALNYLSERLRFDVGIFDGAPDGTENGFSGTGSSYSVFQLNYHDHDGAKDTHLQVGLWYHSGDWERLDGSGMQEGNYGVYLSAEQTLLTFCRRQQAVQAHDRGHAALYWFGQYSYSPENVSSVEHYWNTGLYAKGFLRYRRNDATGIGVTSGTFSKYDRTRYTHEVAVELFHEFAVGEHFVVQPDLQYIIQAGGEPVDALVFGLVFHARF